MGEILDDAVAEANGDAQSLSGQNPCVRVVQYLNTLTASNIYEVLLCLPFSHAMHLLRFLLQFFKAVSTLPRAGGGLGALSAAATLETPCQAALITAYVHHSELAMTARSRTLLLELRQLMRLLLQAEKDRIGLNSASFAHLQRVLKRSSGTVFESAVPKTATKAQAKTGASAKKRKR